MTQCVVVSGLLCVEMCPVWSWFGLYFSLNFLFSFFLTCTSVLMLFVPLVCLSVNLKLLLRLFFYFATLSLQQMFQTPSDPQSLALTHTRPNTHSSYPHGSHLVLCASLRCLTDFLVSLQSRKASEQAKSVDSKTDSIGSGRAIPIKQVSSFTNLFFLTTFPTVPVVSMASLVWVEV